MSVTLSNVSQSPRGWSQNIKSGWKKDNCEAEWRSRKCDQLIHHRIIHSESGQIWASSQILLLFFCFHIECSIKWCDCREKGVTSWVLSLTPCMNSVLVTLLLYTVWFALLNISTKQWYFIRINILGWIYTFSSFHSEPNLPGSSWIH